ncbi:hypothetical protein BsWGS_04948 [Bradybaena similaris]
MVVLVVMGVCGSGKTTVAQELASRLHCVFRDADEFHSEENKKKMSSGVPLTDEDRVPWLLAIHNFIRSLLDKGDKGVVTCSSLKRWYRHLLVTGEVNHKMEPSQALLHLDVVFVYLKGSAELIEARLNHRTGHFMPPSLLQSQLDTMEEPDHSEKHITIAIDRSVENIVADVLGCICV